MPRINKLPVLFKHYSYEKMRAFIWPKYHIASR
jgi:hypothetical protein